MKGAANPAALEKGQEVRILPSGHVHRLKYKPKAQGAFRHLLTFTCGFTTTHEVTVSFPPNAKRCPRCTP